MFCFLSEYHNTSLKVNEYFSWIAHKNSFNISAAGGMGKSTAMKHLALSWADGSVDELKEFNFVFHVALKGVKDNKNIEEIIISQHPALFGNKVQPQEIRSILEEDQKVLIILDGHDEYKPGTNSDIDKIITKFILRNCCVIITSRETKELATIRECIDAEAKITGFDKPRVEEYVTKYMGSSEKCEQLLSKTEEIGIQSQENCGILSIPILLHMICILFLSRVSLPRTKTGIFSAIVERCPHWEEIRKTGQKPLQHFTNTILKLGELAMEGLLREHFQQTFTTVNKAKKIPYIFCERKNSELINILSVSFVAQLQKLGK